MTMDGSPPASGSFPQAAPLVGEVLDGRYRLVKKLGEGGMGEVYAAEHVHIEKRFAVKLLRQEIVSNKEAVSRFRQEARSASSIGHRNIIAIEDFGELPDGRIYMCMELLNGAPLNDLIKQPMSAERLLNILIQTGHGLAAAHAKGIVHRDMKPENVFVTFTPGGEDIPKLLDFGIAKVAGNDGQNNLTRTGTIFGTPYYMAPEQALGTHVDHRTDIYAMGVIMYEVFAGSLPFQGESFMGILTQHITTDPEPVVQRAAKAGRTLPSGMPEIIAKCMQKDANQRFSSMDELVAALIVVYRQVAGAGMSSYMEAFPQSPSSSHGMNPALTPTKMTPPPMTGPVMVGVQHAGQSAPYLPSGGHPASPTPFPPPHQPSGPYAGYDPGSSVVVPKKSKVGLIAALVSVVAVVVAVVAFIAIGGKPKPGSVDAGPVADARIATAPSDAAVVGIDAAGASVDAGTPMADAGVPDAALEPDAGTPATPDAAPPPPDAGAPPHDAAVEVTPARIDVVFSVTPSEAKLYDGRRALSGMRVEVDPRRPKKITVRAAGYESKTVTVNGRDRRVSVVLEKEQVRPVLDCTDKILDRSNAACVRQYCKGHKLAMECDNE